MRRAQVRNIATRDRTRASGWNRGLESVSGYFQPLALVAQAGRVHLPERAHEGGRVQMDALCECERACLRQGSPLNKLFNPGKPMVLHVRAICSKIKRGARDISK